MKHIGNGLLFAVALSALIMFSQRSQVGRWPQADQVHAGATLALALFVVGVVLSLLLFRSKRPARRSRTRGSQSRRQYQDV